MLLASSVCRFRSELMFYLQPFVLLTLSSPCWCCLPCAVHKQIFLVPCGSCTSPTLSLQFLSLLVELSALEHELAAVN